MCKIKEKNNQGFTLLELIVSISIITMLIAIFLTNYSGTSRRTELIMASQKMVTDIRLAQNNTLGSVEYNNQIPLGGWGVHFDISTNDEIYYIFADLDGNSQYDAGEADKDYGGRLMHLPDNIYIENIDKGNVVDITFLPPDPEAIIYDGSPTSSDVTLTLKETKNNSTKDLYINFFGLIEVVD